MRVRSENQGDAKGPVEIISVKQCLIVDNNPDHQELMRLVMEQLSVHASYTSYGTSVVQRIEQLSPDLLVLDLVVGHAQCWETLQAVQENERTRNIPILCLSTDEDLLDHARESLSFPGGAHFLQKPFDIEEVELAVQSLLNWQTKD